jgi:transposase InsO family protein
MSSSWDFMSSTLMMHSWIYAATCYDWVRKKYCYKPPSAMSTILPCGGQWPDNTGTMWVSTDTMGEKLTWSKKKNGLAEPSLQTHMSRRLNIVRTLFWDQPTPIRILNATFQHQTLIEVCLHTVNQSHWWTHSTQWNPTPKSLLRNGYS